MTLARRSRSDSACRAIAHDRDLNPSFGAEGGQGARGARTRLPLPSRALPAEEVAQVRGASDALALWVRIRAENAGLRGPRHRAMASG